jgi:hypothetical protein
MSFKEERIVGSVTTVQQKMEQLEKFLLLSPKGNSLKRIIKASLAGAFIISMTSRFYYDKFLPRSHFLTTKENMIKDLIDNYSYLPIVIDRDPTPEDIYIPDTDNRIQIGTAWINTKEQSIYIITSIVSDKAIWVDYENLKGKKL